jgi:hypothetical protein
MGVLNEKRCKSINVNYDFVNLGNGKTAAIIKK